MTINIKQILEELQSYDITYVRPPQIASDSIATMKNGQDMQILIITVMGHLIVIDSGDVTTFEIPDNHTILDIAKFSAHEMIKCLRNPSSKWEYDPIKAVQNVTHKIKLYTLGVSLSIHDPLCRELRQVARASRNGNDFSLGAYEVCNKYNNWHPNLLNEQMIESIASSGQQPIESFVRAFLAIKLVAESVGILCMEDSLKQLQQLIK